MLRIADHPGVDRFAARFPGWNEFVLASRLLTGCWPLDRNQVLDPSKKVVGQN
jgi:hypothetical protein